MSAAPASLLGRPYFMDAVVEHGEEVGRHLGFPTANLSIAAEKCLPAPGVYAMWVRVDGEWRAAATNVGYRPTFGGDRLTVEAFLLDFAGDMYDSEVRAAFVERLREERAYTTVDELVAQIGRDVEQVRALLTQEPAPAALTRFGCRMSVAGEQVFGIVVVVDAVPLEEEVVVLAGRMHAAVAQFVDAATAMDASLDWSGIGMLTCAHWLTVATGVDLWNAREALRVGHALARTAHSSTLHSSKEDCPSTRSARSPTSRMPKMKRPGSSSQCRRPARSCRGSAGSTAAPSRSMTRTAQRCSGRAVGWCRGGSTTTGCSPCTPRCHPRRVAWCSTPSNRR